MKFRNRLKAVVEKVADAGLPPLGFHLLMVEKKREKVTVTNSGTYKKMKKQEKLSVGVALVTVMRRSIALPLTFLKTQKNTMKSVFLETYG